jgi:hypothetical protein
MSAILNMTEKFKELLLRENVLHFERVKARVELRDVETDEVIGYSDTRILSKGDALNFKYDFEVTS